MNSIRTRISNDNESLQTIVENDKYTATIRLSLYGNGLRVQDTCTTRDINNSRTIAYGDEWYSRYYSALEAYNFSVSYYVSRIFNNIFN